MKGIPIDIEKIRMLNGDQKAIGNANLNARGDKLDSNGRVIRSREELVNKLNQRKESGIRYVGLSSMDQEISNQNQQFKTIPETAKELKVDQPENIKRRKKLIDEE